MEATRYVDDVMTALDLVHRFETIEQPFLIVFRESCQFRVRFQLVEEERTLLVHQTRFLVEALVQAHRVNQGRQGAAVLSSALLQDSIADLALKFNCCIVCWGWNWVVPGLF